jgi:hypothetical protein
MMVYAQTITAPKTPMKLDTSREQAALASIAKSMRAGDTLGHHAGHATRKLGCALMTLGLFGLLFFVLLLAV